MKDEFPDMQGPVCPLPLSHGQKIILGHGSGGKLTQDLILKFFLPSFDNPVIRQGNDAGIVKIIRASEMDGEKVGCLAISTDSHVVWPLFFPGGDIGRLAVCGTVNDISMMGANPLYLTAGFILEEGLDIEILEMIVSSMQSAAAEAKIEIVAGDTKVVQKGKADCVYINTSGFGILPDGIDIHGANAKPGDRVIISGSIGDHGIAVLGARGDMGFETGIKSDIAPLNHLINSILETSNQIHTMRDPTRGGLATSLNEIAKQSHVCITINEHTIPVKPPVEAVCEMLGFDPLYVANEGKVIVIVAPEDADEVLSTMKSNQYGTDAAIIGAVEREPEGLVLMKTSIGSTRIVETLSGEMLPRIC